MWEDITSIIFLLEVEEDHASESHSVCRLFRKAMLRWFSALSWVEIISLPTAHPLICIPASRLCPLPIRKHGDLWKLTLSKGFCFLAVKNIKIRNTYKFYLFWCDVDKIQRLKTCTIGMRSFLEKIMKNL